MKSKILTSTDSEVLEYDIDKFIKDKKVFTISYAFNRNHHYYANEVYSVLIMYKGV